ncbi:hypothetical protein B0J17DRAFT_636419 [Rhizoctonia solani]|nr:hypothetical protein B0J17DRAFT_636419 [Rhizoctonia solani]
MPKRYNKKRKSKSSAISPQTTQDKRKGKSTAPSSLDPEYCHSSESEPEDYGDLNGQEKWEIDGVVDSHCGENDRMSYKIRWNKDDWQRANGTSEEIPEPVDTRSVHANLVRKYGATELSKLDSLEVRPFTMARENGRYFSHLHFGAPGCSKNIWNQTRYPGVFAVGNAHVSRFYMTDPDFIPEDDENDSDSDSSTGQPPAKTRAVVPKRERNSSISLGGTPHTSSQQVPLTALQELELKWNRAASAAGAAPITLSNNMDKSIPSLKQTFEYSEMDLRWSPELKNEGYPLGLEAFTSCDCYECDFPHKCHCQKPVFDPNRPRASHKFAYGRNGRFNLNFQGVSVECNMGCRCPATCPNRVVQRPRSVHIEIVKFEIRGWGVRARQDIVAGQVLGSFTGEIITKEAASRITANIATIEMSSGQQIKFRDRNQYLFDLDSRHEKYTLDCWGVGNWTRFINHKCEPNLKIFSVCYDTLPDTGLERHAVVALRDIPAGEELGFDYHPTTEPGEGTISCSCGSQKCRGYI